MQKAFIHRTILVPAKIQLKILWSFLHQIKVLSLFQSLVSMRLMNASGILSIFDWKFSFFVVINLVVLIPGFSFLVTTLNSFSFFSGYKMSRATCRNRVTGADVEDSLCNVIVRPEPAVVQCNTHSCPPK